MKVFKNVFFVCWAINAVFFIHMFANMSFFGAAPSGLELEEAIYIVFTWALIPALTFAGIAAVIAKGIRKLGPQPDACPQCGQIRKSTDNFCPNCGYNYSESK
jgi:hypothetical protein